MDISNNFYHNLNNLNDRKLNVSRKLIFISPYSKIFTSSSNFSLCTHNVNVNTIENRTTCKKIGRWGGGESQYSRMTRNLEIRKERTVRDMSGVR